jgi:hypothetical protein
VVALEAGVVALEVAWLLAAAQLLQRWAETGRPGNSLLDAAVVSTASFSLAQLCLYTPPGGERQPLALLEGAPTQIHEEELLQPLALL